MTHVQFIHSNAVIASDDSPQKLAPEQPWPGLAVIF
jgi:hypothetical protein